MLRHVLGRALDQIIPRKCAACDGPTTEVLLCTVCSESLYPNPDNPIAAPYLYGGELATAIQHLKYGRRPDIARRLGHFIAPLLHELCAKSQSNAIVPVPCHWRVRLSRGMDTNLEILAGARPPVPIIRGLYKARHTRRQVGLSRRERASNLLRSFKPSRRSHALAGRRVVLFDDVVTTRATLDAAAECLYSVGCLEVQVFAVARSDSAP